jgi:hypothetical protein
MHFSRCNGFMVIKFGYGKIGQEPEVGNTTKRGVGTEEQMNKEQMKSNVER